MTDRPIIFSRAMVRALLNGRKTMTRRLLNPQPYPLEGKPGFWNASGVVGGRICSSDAEFLALHRWAVGDRLYVRESFAPRYFDLGEPAYMADWTGESADCVPEPKWKPSIHMPRSISRITLTVTAVKVERLQDISEADATAEGIMWDYMRDPHASGPGACRYFTPAIDTPTALKGFNTAAGAFRALWDSLNAKRAPWDSNPWVVASTFIVHKCNIDQLEKENVHAVLSQKDPQEHGGA